MAKAEHQKAMCGRIAPALRAKSHGKRLAAFRETLESAHASSRHFQPGRCLDSVYDPKSPSRVHETDSPFRRWTFPKKEQEFRLFSSSLFEVSSKRF
jgi:hypothetical protein